MLFGVGGFAIRKIRLVRLSKYVRALDLISIGMAGTPGIWRQSLFRRKSKVKIQTEIKSNNILDAHATE